MSCNLPETDRKKNQFDKEERVHLLALMKRYAPLLDMSPSTLARKRIWLIIEEEFKNAGFTRKTSAQLKKYWQNYKYHCKKAKASGKESKRYGNSDDSECSEWNRYRILVDDRPVTKFPEVSEPLRSMPDYLQKSPIESERRSTEISRNDENSPGKLNVSDGCIDLSRVKREWNEETINDRDAKETNPSKNLSFEEDSLEEKKEIFTYGDQSVSPSTSATRHKTRNHIVVSNARISDNSVTVSVIYPEDNARVPKNTIDPALDAGSFANRSAEVSWHERKEKPDSPNSIQDPNAARSNLFGRDTDRGNADRTNGKSNNEQMNSFACTGGEDLIHCRQMDQDFGAERRENDVAIRAKRFEAASEPFRSRGHVFLTDYSNRLRHRLLLQQLETEEKRLKVQIAETTFQEAQLRIKAVYEDMRRTEELHRLRLLRAAASTATLAENLDDVFRKDL
ncbi:uncharacterized protein LOC143264044 isoform X1 [Megachile rotundata]|uniref:uncharacterized protein LOC143264044 isoform X1 n=1 Tax=Megachile rotundata TaxID=143995 RepID=UPI003FD0C54A